MQSKDCSIDVHLLNLQELAKVSQQRKHGSGTQEAHTPIPLLPFLVMLVERLPGKLDGNVKTENQRGSMISMHTRSCIRIPTYT